MVSTFRGYRPKSKDEQRFADKHAIVKHPDRNGNKDDVFNAKNVKTVDREPDHGYNPGNDERVYENNEHPLTLHKTKEKAKTIAHPDGKPVYNLHYNGEHIGTIKPYNDYKETSRAGSRIVTSRKNITRYQIFFHNDKGPQGYNNGFDTSEFLNHSSAKGAHERAKKLHDRWKSLNETYAIKSKGFEKASLVKNGKIIKTFNGPSAAADARLHLSKLVKEEALDEVKKGDYYVHSETGKVGKVHHVSGDKEIIGLTYNKSGRKIELPKDEFHKYHEKSDLKEDIEQIDEISRNTISSYIKKSSANRDSNNAKNDESRAWLRSSKNRKDDNRKFNDLLSDIDKRTKTIIKRDRGLDMAFRKEDVEILDELSTDTIKSYAKKAHNQRRSDIMKNDEKERHLKQFPSRMTTRDHMQYSTIKDGIKRRNKTIDRRNKGLNNAEKRLTKESLIDGIIERFTPENYEPKTLEDRLVENLSGLSASHVNLLLNLFNTLNEDNQLRLIDLTEDTDNIPELVDFALENRELNELSKDTLRSYSQKATKQLSLAGRMSDNGRKKDMAHIANKRASGLQRSINKLAGE